MCVIIRLVITLLGDSGFLFKKIIGCGYSLYSLIYRKSDFERLKINIFAYLVVSERFMGLFPPISVIQ